MFQIDVSTAASTQPASTALGTVGFFTDGNAATGVPATVVPAEFLNAIMLEMMNTIAGAGLTLSKSSFNQLFTAIKSIGQGGASNYSADYGSANAYAATYSPTVPAPTDGAVRAFKVKTANTGPSTFILDGSGVAYPIYGLGGSALQGGELTANGIAVMRFNSALSTSGAWVLYHCGGGAQQLPAGSYGVTPPQFDNGTKLATTAFVQRQGLSAAQCNVITSGSTTLTAANAGQTIIGGVGTPFTLTLPLAGSVPSGARIEFVNVNGGVMTVTRQGSDTLNPGTTRLSEVLGVGDSLILESNGVNMWYEVGGTVYSQYSASFASSLSGSGYQKLPSGFIFQWGTSVSVASGAVVTVTLPIAFPSAFISGWTSINAGGGVLGGNYTCGVGGNASQILLSGYGAATASYYWFAIGK